MTGYQVLALDHHTGRAYGEIRATLFTQRAPRDRGGRITKKAPEDRVEPTTAKALVIRENDLWIVSVAVQYNLKFVTADQAEGRRRKGFGAGYPHAMKFIVDNNVGKLAVWLRALGYDAVFINPIADSDLVEIARQEGRVILTKDTGILRRRVVTSGEVRAVRIYGDDWREQLAQVVRELGLETQPQFTRCIECNSPLEPRTRDEVRPYVPPYVYRTQTSFLVCPSCGRYYWQGTHWQRMRGDLARILE